MLREGMHPRGRPLPRWPDAKFLVLRGGGAPWEGRWHEKPSGITRVRIRCFNPAPGAPEPQDAEFRASGSYEVRPDGAQAEVFTFTRLISLPPIPQG